MQYDIEKLIDILVLLAKNGQQLNKLRITKLLYFIDKFHIRKYGRFVLNDRYHGLPLGPIPSLTLNYINDFFKPKIRISGIKVEKNPLEGYFSAAKYRNYDVLKLKNKDINLNSLSESELEAVDRVIKKYGNYSTSSLVTISHNEKTWKETSKPKEIDFELFLHGLPEEEKEAIKKLREIDQENDCVNVILNK